MNRKGLAAPYSRQFALRPLHHGGQQHHRPAQLHRQRPGRRQLLLRRHRSTPAGTTAPSNEARAITGTPLHTYLPFDAGSGASAADASGNGHPGTLAGGAIWVAGNKANAVALDGSSGYVSLPASLMADVGDFTIAAWVYWNAARNWERIFDFGSGVGGYMMLTARANSGKLRFAMTVNGGNCERTIEGAAALPTAQWVHVAVTLSGRNATLYVNGAVSGSNADIPGPVPPGRHHPELDRPLAISRPVLQRKNRRFPYLPGRAQRLGGACTDDRASAPSYR